jgi:glucose-6-phosphate isomerase
VEWKKLENHAASVKEMHLKSLLQDSSRCAALVAEHDGIMLDFSRENVLPATMEMLFDLAGAAGLEQKRAAMAAGQHINTTEDRAVMHVALRAPKGKVLMVDGADVVPDVHAVLTKIADFTERVRNGSWVGATGKKLSNVLCIGIGGSFLGPEFVFEALRTDPTGSAAATGRSLRFLANVDPVDVARALAGTKSVTLILTTNL